MLITVAQAKAHLRRPDLPDDDADLAQVMEAAEASILGYINTTEYWRAMTAGWTDPTTTPVDVRHALLRKAAELYRFRGDELGGVLNAAPIDTDSDMSPAIVRLLRRWRDPILLTSTSAELVLTPSPPTSLLPDPVTVPHGGTGLTSYVTGDLLFALDSATLAALPLGASGTFLAGDGLPSYRAITLSDLPATVATKPLAVADGGTGVTTGLTILNASNLASGTIPVARFPADMVLSGTIS